MNMNLMTNQILTDWQPHHASLFGNHSLALAHNLATSSLFTDEALARLIENSPREAYHVNYSQKTPGNPPKRREGEIKGLSGLEVLDTVRNGNIWVNLTAPGTVDSAYTDLLNSIYAEFEERVPGFKSYKRNLTILISSPNVSVKYHSDVPGQSLWQVRGTKKLYVYPASKPFISQPALEKLILGQLRETDMPYEAWYDDYAEMHMLEAGKMLHWPLNGPHRVVNENMLNVSFTTEHWTDELRKHYAVNYANGFIRGRTGANNLSQQITGLSYYAKLGLAGLVKFSPLNPQKKRSTPSIFK
ncbi:hypothetical protein PSQ90_08345 [Devosia rhodophyticola]|uniref:JmjC domain-containing protein n=1 Tax=Devosia rhodophyticola TaxID=3026423 RepID=A0ABY7Z199_9HYPH|nr:hypothetical protein [Devosia rhodophyticola]WDR07413.1 hypothetical protein PSQ90_08345 [Devosia rhodophyticola]